MTSYNSTLPGLLQMFYLLVCTHVFLATAFVKLQI